MSSTAEPTATPTRRLRIGIGGMATASSAFSPHHSTYDDFEIRRGRALLDRYPWTRPDSDLSALAEWVPLVHAEAIPGGPVTPETYRRIKTELVERIREAGPLDGLVHDIHGAMSVDGMEDADGDLTGAAREAIGQHALISAAMDAHGNVSEPFVRDLDLITAHRLSPHQDAAHTRERAARKLVERLIAGKARPHVAWVQVPLLLPGEETDTRWEPARSLFGRLSSIEAMEAVVDAAVWAGYAWADEPRCRAAVVVTADDPVLAVEHARSLAREYWEARRDFTLPAPAADADACIARAVASGARPFFISDTGDNPAAGGVGDLPYMLGRLLADKELAAGRVTALHAGIADPRSVLACWAAGVGGLVTLHVGGGISGGSGSHADAYVVTGEVVALRRDDAAGGDLAAVRSGGVTVVLTSRRKPFRTLADFGDLDPRGYDLVVLKTGCLEPELYEVAADWLLARTPGAVDQRLLGLGHRRLERPLFPFDPDMTADLSPVLL